MLKLKKTWKNKKYRLAFKIKLTDCSFYQSKKMNTKKS